MYYFTLSYYYCLFTISFFGCFADISVCCFILIASFHVNIVQSVVCYLCVAMCNYFLLFASKTALLLIS